MATQTWIAASDLSCAVEAVSAVRIQIVGGSVSITSRPEPGVQLEVSDVVGTPLEVTADGVELTVGYATIGWEGFLKRVGNFRSTDTATVRLAVGPGIRVRVAVVGASTHVVGVAEDVTIASAAGAVTVAGVHGAVTARSVSGAIELTDQQGAVRLNSVSGSVSATGAIPRVDAATVSGAINLVTSLASGVVRAQTVSGALALALPAGSGLVLTARTVSAPVLVDGVDRRTGSGPSSTSLDERGEGEAHFVDVVTVTGPVTLTRGEQAVVLDTRDAGDAEVEDDAEQGPEAGPVE